MTNLDIIQDFLLSDLGDGSLVYEGSLVHSFAEGISEFQFAHCLIQSQHKLVVNS